MSCDDCLSRRAFLAKGTLAVAGAAAVVSGCGDGQIGPSGITSNVSGAVSVKVSSVPALATVGTLVQITPLQAFIAVKRTGPTTFLALSMICTHEGCATVVRQNRFDCDCHNSRFDSDGKVTRPPALRNLPTYTTRYDAATDTLTIS